MKIIINIIAALPALASAIALFIMFAMSFDYTWLIIPCIFQSIGTLFLADNIRNISLNIYKIIALLKS